MNNVVSIIKTTVPPKTFKVRHKGLHGTVTFDPATKKWNWRVIIHTPMLQEGSEESQEKATLALKRILEVASTGKDVTTHDS